MSFVLLAGGAGAVPVVEWNKTFTGSGGGAVWLIKPDVNGTEQWNRTFQNLENRFLPTSYGGHIGEFLYPGANVDVRSIRQTSDGGYILSGTSWNEGAWLIKIDVDGNELWNRTFGELHGDAISV